MGHKPPGRVWYRAWVMNLREQGEQHPLHLAAPGWGEVAGRTPDREKSMPVCWNLQIGPAHYFSAFWCVHACVSGERQAQEEEKIVRMLQWHFRTRCTHTWGCTGDWFVPEPLGVCVCVCVCRRDLLEEGLV
jgi:hypothetical protein